MPRWGCESHQLFRKRKPVTILIVGIDLAKNVFAVHGVAARPWRLRLTDLSGHARGAAARTEDQLEDFVVVAVHGAGWLPAQMPIEAVGADLWVRRAPEEQALMSGASELRDHAFKQLTAEADPFGLWQKCKNNNFTGLRVPEAIAKKLFGTLCRIADQSSSSNVA